MIIFDSAANVTGEPIRTEYTVDREPPSRDEIADLAYHFYESHGKQDGHDFDDWLAAEHELTRHYRWLKPDDRFIGTDVN